MTTNNTSDQLPNRRLIPFLVGTALGNAGDLFTQIAVFWTGLSITGTALSIAGLGGVWTLGAALAGLASGPIVDRFNRRNLLIYLHSLLALLCFVVFAFSRAGSLQMWHLWCFLIGEAIFGTPVTAAFNAILPDIVPKDRLVRVNGLLSSWGMADNLIEAALSGVILALWGPAPIFLFNGVMYLVGAAAALFVPQRAGTPHKDQDKPRWRPIHDLRCSFRYIAQEKLLRRVVTLDFLSDVVFAPLFFLAPVVSAAIGMGSQGYGFLQSLSLGGVLAGSLVASSIGAKWPKFAMWIGGTILFSLAFLALGIHLVPTAALIVFFLFGLGVAGGRVYGHTLIQQVLPSKIRGRVNGIQAFLGGILQPVSLAVVMALIDVSGVERVLIWLSLLMLVIAACYLLLLPLREKNWVLSEPQE
ncbi:MFS transporter [Candidatus Bipolaricaulota bacterium]|nr:MFS transporter [Candidatus Bipolaricaulota bacterium]